VLCQSLLTGEVSLQWGTAKNPHGGETHGTRGDYPNRLDEPVPESA
jgi:hypothetical protein